MRIDWKAQSHTGAPSNNGIDACVRDRPTLPGRPEKVVRSGTRDSAPELVQVQINTARQLCRNWIFERTFRLDVLGWDVERP
jgi:hypothetical protein